MVEEGQRADITDLFHVKRELLVHPCGLRLRRERLFHVKQFPGLGTAELG